MYIAYAVQIQMITKEIGVNLNWRNSLKGFSGELQFSFTSIYLKSELINL